MQLTIDIGQTHHIIIYQHKMTHAGPGQPLDNIRTYAANAKHGHTGLGQTLQAIPSQEQLGTGKSMY